MSSHGDSDAPKFGHIFEVFDEDDTGEAGIEPEIREKIKEGEITDFDELSDEIGDTLLKPIMGDPYKTVKVSAGSQGTPIGFILSAVDKLNDSWGWETPKTMEQMFVTPESNLHNEFMQRRQQAEQNVKQAMQGIEQLRKSKHMLQHDIRKLRSKVENLKTNDETTIKGDFIELVDSAGGGQQSSAPGSLDFLRNNNIYPSIVADFQEMHSVEDLLTAEQKANKHGGDPSEYEDGPLAELPENEKAVLKKKYTLYEQWKDLYGSEIERKLEDLKKELRRVETALEEQKKQTAPYVRDMVMINQKDTEELANDLDRYMSYRGYATQFQMKEFICYQPVAQHHGELEEVEDEDHATHYKVIYIHAVHVNIAGGENPNSPAEGPTVAKLYWHPAIVDKFIFERIFKPKIERNKDRFKNLMKKYTGSFETDEGDKFEEKRQEAGLSVRKLREKVGEKVDGSVPLEFSSTIRRIEDGFDKPEIIKEDYGEEYLEAVDEILDTKYSKDDDEDKPEPLSDLRRELKLFTGQTDDYYISKPEDVLGDMLYRMKFSYYFDLKLGMGLYTMK